ncbi:hypothetical protein HID58_064460, partial [Brassica napus]
PPPPKPCAIYELSSFDVSDSHIAIRFTEKTKFIEIAETINPIPNEMFRKCFSLPLQFLKPASRRPSLNLRVSRLGRSNQSIASGFLRFWDSLNFKKDMEFVGITVLFLDEKVNMVGQIHSVQGSDLTKETTRVVIRLLIDP